MTKDKEEKESFRATFVELFKESTIIQALVTVMVVGTVCTLALAPLFSTRKVDVPEWLLLLAGTVLGYWFETKRWRQGRKEEKSSDSD